MANNSSLTDNFVKALSYYLALSGKSKKEVADGIGIALRIYKLQHTEE